MVTTIKIPFYSDNYINPVYPSIVRYTMEITTIKLNKSTKDRLDKLRVYKRETYDEILQEALEIIGLSRTFPERARARLLGLERERRRNLKLKPVQSSERSSKPQSSPQTY